MIYQIWKYIPTSVLRTSKIIFSFSFLFCGQTQCGVMLLLYSKYHLFKSNSFGLDLSYFCYFFLLAVLVYIIGKFIEFEYRLENIWLWKLYWVLLSGGFGNIRFSYQLTKNLLGLSIVYKKFIGLWIGCENFLVLLWQFVKRHWVWVSTNKNSLSIVWKKLKSFLGRPKELLNLCVCDGKIYHVSVSTI